MFWLFVGSDMEYDTDQCTDEQLKDATRYILIRKLTQSYKFNQKYLKNTFKNKILFTSIYKIFILSN